MPLLETVFSESKLKKLIEKYQGNTPRYTSYPTAVEFHPGIGEDEVRDHYLKHASQTLSTPISIYAHLPFCRTLCYFCACNKVISRDRSMVGAFLDAIEKEIQTYHQITENHSLSVEQFHWGGGTPNYLSPEESIRLFKAFNKAFPNFSKDADISVEVDPRTLSDEHLDTYHELGFTRISMGVQDFDHKVQVAINRVQSYEETAHIAEYARTLGFPSINLDLIYGLPEQSTETFQDTLTKVISIRPDRIALYGYAHVTWKKKVQKTLQRHNLPSAKERIDLFLIAIDSLIQAGYQHIGMDHFALPDDGLAKAQRSGKLNRNFMGYSTHGSTIVCGFGPSAVSSYERLYAMNEGDLLKYKSEISNGKLAISKGLLRSTDDCIRAEMIESLLCQLVVDLSIISNKWDINCSTYFASELQELEAYVRDGLVVLSGTRIEITQIGKLFMRNIVSVFDAYLAGHNSSKNKVFSQSL